MNYVDESALQMYRFCSDWFNEPLIRENNNAISRREKSFKKVYETLLGITWKIAEDLLQDINYSVIFNTGILYYFWLLWFSTSL